MCTIIAPPPHINVMIGPILINGLTLFHWHNQEWCHRHSDDVTMFYYCRESQQEQRTDNITASIKSTNHCWRQSHVTHLLTDHRLLQPKVFWEKKGLFLFINKPVLSWPESLRCVGTLLPARLSPGWRQLVVWQEVDLCRKKKAIPPNWQILLKKEIIKTALLK